MIRIILALVLCGVLPTASHTQAISPADSTIVARYEVIDVRLADIQSALDEIDKRTEEPLWKKVKDDFISNFLWDLVSSKNSITNHVGRITSVLGLVFLLARIAFFVASRGKTRDVGGNITSSFLFLYLMLAVPTLLAISFSGGMVTRDVSPLPNTRAIEARLDVLLEETREIRTLVAQNAGAALIAAAPDSLHAIMTDRIDAVGIQLVGLEAAVKASRKGLAGHGLLALNTMILLTLALIVLWPRIKQYLRV